MAFTDNFTNLAPWTHAVSSSTGSVSQLVPNTITITAGQGNSFSQNAFTRPEVQGRNVFFGITFRQPNPFNGGQVHFRLSSDSKSLGFAYLSPTAINTAFMVDGGWGGQCSLRLAEVLYYNPPPINPDAIFRLEVRTWNNVMHATLKSQKPDGSFIVSRPCFSIDDKFDTLTSGVNGPATYQPSSPNTYSDLVKYELKEYVHFAAVGDSTTEGVETWYIDPFSLWTSQLQDAAGTAPVGVCNYGVGGYSTMDIIDRILPKVIPAKGAYNVAHVLVGFNNLFNDPSDKSLEKLKNDTLFIVSTLRSRGFKPIWVGTLWNTYAGAPNWPVANPAINRYNDWLRSNPFPADGEPVTIIDYHKAFADPKDPTQVYRPLLKDGCHPLKAGEDVMVQQLLPHFNKLLNTTLTASSISLTNTTGALPPKTSADVTVSKLPANASNSPRGSQWVQLLVPLLGLMPLPWLLMM
ncbi:hypothetical protein HDU96_001008 [Phlyctochytrium bullatum]|nr:hypothetical protein HDU96_001008 [Phlyctochytrium bullatum]